MTVINGIWQEFLKIIHEEVGSRVVETWFKAISLKHWDAPQKIVYLEAPNSFVKQWIQKNYLALFQTHLGRLLYVDKPKVIFIDEDQINQSQLRQQEPRLQENGLALVHMQGATADNAPKNGLIKAPPVAKRVGQVNRNYLFETFVVGPSNSLAYAAAHAVTEKPGRLYNPLFIYGESGLGKTHLLHAIGNGIKAKNKDVTILYQTADRFVNEFINAIRFDKIHKFQAKYHSIDVFLVDDVQFISNKEQTQEAFFHIFNSLYEANKQIVFSSDTFPQNISGIAERLSSRLACGLVTDIHMPSLETKIAILKKKIATSDELVDDAVAHFIASHAANIRELEGALIRVMAFASLTHQPVTLELAQKVLTHATQQKQQLIDFERIIKGVSKHYSYTLHDLKSKERNKDLAHARHVAIYLMKKLTDKSLRDIGSFLGGRDHSTVMHAIGKMEEYLKAHPEMQIKLKQIESDIMI